MPEADAEAHHNPCQRNQWHHPLHQTGKHRQTARHKQQAAHRQHQAGQRARHLPGEVNGARHYAGLNGVKHQPISEEQENGEEHAHPAHAKAARHIPGRAAAQLIIGIALFIELGQRALGETGRHADKRRDPHPEDRARSASGEGKCHARQVATA